MLFQKYLFQKFFFKHTFSRILFQEYIFQEWIFKNALSKILFQKYLGFSEWLIYLQTLKIFGKLLLFNLNKFNQFLLFIFFRQKVSVQRFQFLALGFKDGKISEGVFDLSLITLPKTEIKYPKSGGTSSNEFHIK